MKRIIFFIFLKAVSGCITVIAQQVVPVKNEHEFLTFKGRVVISGSEIPLPQATITLLKNNDSSVVSNTVCDAFGNYVLHHVPSSSYILSATYIGYEKQFRVISPENFSHGVSVDTFQLRRNNGQLSAVKVTQRKPLIEFQHGKVIMNVENMITGSGGTVLELLENAPYVSISGNGGIKLNGKTGVQIMIDGKPSYLSAQQVLLMLKSTSANEVNKIELISNPSAKYDAAGNGGIINIITKKNLMKGFNANITNSYSLGYYPKFNGAVNLNYKRGKINLFGSYMHYESKNKHYSYTRYTFNASGLIKIIGLNEDEISKTGSDNLKMGIDYALTNKSSVILGIKGRTYQRNDISFNETETSLNGDPNEYLQTRSMQEDRYRNISTYCYFESKLDTGGRKISLDADYTYFSNPQNGNFNTCFFDKDGSMFQSPSLIKNNNTAGLGIISVKADYEMPLKRNIKFEAGVKLNMIKTGNHFKVDTLRGNDWIKDLSASNDFRYSENISAAYLILSKQFKSITAQVGLRAEHTGLNGKQFTMDSTFRNNFLDFFPSFSIEKTVNTNNILAFSFGKRIYRPDYEMLNPFTYYSDPYTITKGNPYLLPQYTLNFNLTHSYKDMFNTTLTYSRITKLFIQVSEQDSVTNVTKFNYINLDAMDVLNLSVGARINVTRFWKSFLNLSAGYSKVSSGNLFGGTLSKSITDLSFNSTNTVTINKNTTLQVSGFYNMPTVYAFKTLGSVFSISAAIQRVCWDKRVTIKLNLADIFKSQVYTSRGKYMNQDITMRSIKDTRQLRLSFMYKIGSGTGSVRNKASASKDELQRLKQ